MFNEYNFIFSFVLNFSSQALVILCDHLPFSNKPYVDKPEIKNRTSDIKHDQVCLYINHFIFHIENLLERYL